MTLFIQRSFLKTIKAQGLYDVADLDVDPYDGDQYEVQLVLKKQSIVDYVLVTSRQFTKEANWSRSLK